eukprot:COSAG01_NODE_55763_length_323_cov_0.383929_1_plen_42_part_01
MRERPAGPREASPPTRVEAATALERQRSYSAREGGKCGFDVS